MAQRRMFSKEVTTSDLFVDMPSSSQLLYFHLGMEADDEGFIGNAKMLSRAYGSNNDDLKLLEAKGFIIAFPSGVTVVKDWNLNNKIRKDRQKPTIYTEEKTLLTLDSKGSYLLGNQVSTIPQPNDNQMSAQDRIGEVRLGKDSIGKDSIDASQPNAFQEKSSGEDINSLLSEYLDSFIEFSSKNIAKRAMAQVEFMKLSSEEKKQAVIGAKNYFEWYKQENPEDKTKKFSINSYAFLESATFKSFQQKVKVKKETLGGLI
ncbi:phage replisome organizer protein [Lactococcus cremoris]|uniref:Phage replication initiation protein n=1 Tax=Lactococcus lactis subsp. cremoris (strain MG1363) TaxID=416870 RepID=A2RN05_LACLM|nr:phage replisome organiser protein [Lactococcus cremoris]ADJ61094.1 phage replication initiation protein [Lactococcus cremoris subsp. cremoris NZ9000]KZK51653.1 DNA replication protein phage-associated [Lactococcus cremoris]MCZ7689412.1 phage replisome organizer protein [Lactococcus cremoris]MCZ7691849.1 phage replisome organizer protein [Lactococcus cremoris]CAL98692.1 phage replication initiation protein [Lactococcus cremoris subsp. cremoris MG1363]